MTHQVEDVWEDPISDWGARDIRWLPNFLFMQRNYFVDLT